MTAAEDRQDSPSTLPSATWFILCIGLAAMGNDQIVSRCWPATTYGLIEFSVGVGVLIAEACLLAIWAAVANQSAFDRFASSFAALLGLGSAFLFSVSRTAASISEEVVWYGGFATLLQYCLLVLILGRLTKNQSVTQHESARVFFRGEERLSVKKLLVCTTLFAVAIGVSTKLAPRDIVFGYWPAWISFMMFCLPFVAQATWFSILSFGFVFRTEKHEVFGWLLAISIFVVPLLVTVAVTLLFVFISGDSFYDVFAECCGNVIGYSFSLIVTILLVQIVFYQLGFRIRAVKTVGQ